MECLDHERFMRRAIALTANCPRLPFGALIVSAVYVDAVEWVELPNTLGMSQFADGGVMASKPLLCDGRLSRPDEQRLPGLSLRSEESNGPRRLPVHHALLGLPRTAREAARPQSADDDAAQESLAQIGRRPAGDPPASGRSRRSDLVEFPVGSDSHPGGDVSGPDASRRQTESATSLLQI